MHKAPGPDGFNARLLTFINDLPDNIKSSVRLFADDCVLYRNIDYFPRLSCYAGRSFETFLRFGKPIGASRHSMRVDRH